MHYLRKKGRMLLNYVIQYYILLSLNRESLNNKSN